MKSFWHLAIRHTKRKRSLKLITFLQRKSHKQKGKLVTFIFVYQLSWLSWRRKHKSVSYVFLKEKLLMMWPCCRAMTSQSDSVICCFIQILLLDQMKLTPGNGKCFLQLDHLVGESTKRQSLTSHLTGHPSTLRI